MIKPNPIARLIYGLAVFCSAFLLFQVQPLMGKIILPWFGGAAGVWTVCLVFFQTVLLLGYLYAHLLTRLRSPRTAGMVHALLLAASLCVLPILPRDSWKPGALGDPSLRILGVLALTAGLPYFLLSSASPLLQAWYAGSQSGATPYRFYALSNTASLLALLSYPLVVEPRLTVRHQAIGWSIAYAVAALLCAAIALGRRGANGADALSVRQETSAPNWNVRWLWFALAACASALLLAVTNHISQNVAAVPLLWVIPLSLYLFSFILCFEGRAWYNRWLFLRLLGVALGGMAYAMAPDFSAGAPVWVIIPLFCAGLFVCCMVCHGELARLKPHPAFLTSFYLMISFGGATGAVFVALLAPHLFSGFYELPIAMGACAVLVLVVLRSDPGSEFYRARFKPAWLVLVALVVALLASLFVTARQQRDHTRFMARNFYGVLRVFDVAAVGAAPAKISAEGVDETDAPFRKLMNGTIDHGVQFLAPSRRREPTAYYTMDSGVGLALRAMGRRGPLRVGVIGLGAGTLAAYGRPGDHYTFYEINPLVVEVANRDFTFLGDSPATIDIVMGDARLSLEREPPQEFDVLVVDAFSGDSVPVHLLTLQAYQLYFRHLKPDGVLAVHVSNKYLNLEPIAVGAASSLDKLSVVISRASDTRAGFYASTWVLSASPGDFFDQPELGRTWTVYIPEGNRAVWTDDYSSLFRVLK